MENSTYKIMAWLPSSGNVALVAPNGSVGWAGPSTEYHFQPMFPQFIESAVQKHWYVRLKTPLEVTLEDLPSVVEHMERGFEANSGQGQGE